MPTGKKIREIRKKKKKPAPKPKLTQKDKDDIRKERETENLKKIRGKTPPDPGPGRDREGKKRTATLKQDRRRNRRWRIPKIPSVNYETLTVLGDYGRDVSDKASSRGGGPGGDVGGQDAPEISKLQKSGASFGARYIGAFDEEDTENAAGRK